MAASGDETAAGAAGRGQLRASHADREQVIDTLKAAFVQGRLAKNEFDLRIGQVLTSRTYADLAALIADLPSGLAGVQPPGPTVPAQVQPTANKALLWGSWVTVLLTAGFTVGAFHADYWAALFVGVLLLLIATPIAGILTIDTWREKRSRGPLPPRPELRGRALEGEHQPGLA